MSRFSFKNKFLVSVIFFDVSNEYSIFINQQKVINIKSGCHTIIKVNPKDLLIFIEPAYIFSSYSKDAIRLEKDRGKRYFIRVNGINLKIINKEVAIREIGNTNYQENTYSQ